jgi:hypothetical protein
MHKTKHPVRVSRQIRIDIDHAHPRHCPIDMDTPSETEPRRPTGWAIHLEIPPGTEEYREVALVRAGQA